MTRLVSILKRTTRRNACEDCYMSSDTSSGALSASDESFALSLPPAVACALSSHRSIIITFSPDTKPPMITQSLDHDDCSSLGAAMDYYDPTLSDYIAASGKRNRRQRHRPSAYPSTKADSSCSAEWTAWF